MNEFETFLLLSLDAVRVKCDGEPFWVTGPPLTALLIVVVVFAVFVTYFFGEEGGDLAVSLKCTAGFEPSCI